MLGFRIFVERNPGLGSAGYKECGLSVTFGREPVAYVHKGMSQVNLDQNAIDGAARQLARQ
jgi:hypothetical protein